MKVPFLNHLLMIFISFLLVFSGSLTSAASPNENDDPDSDIHPLMRDAGSEQIQKPSKENKEGSSISPQDDSRKKYKWLFKEAGPQQGESLDRPLGLLEKFDRQVKQARKLYLGGEKENSILEYRNSIDQFELILDDLPPGSTSLTDLEARFSIFEEMVIRILGPLNSEIKEDDSGLIFHLMEKRRLARRNLTLKKAGLIEPHDVTPELLTRENELLVELNELQTSIPTTNIRKAEEDLKLSLIELRQSIQKKSPKYSFLRKSLPISLAEVRRDFIAPNELVLDFNLFSDRMVVGMLSKDDGNYFQIPIDRRDLEKGIFFLQDRLREFMLGSQSSFMGHAWKEPCRRVYRSLLGRLPTIPTDKNVIFVVPDRSLWYLPFSALLDPEDRPFGQDRVITMIPSADFLKFNRSIGKTDDQLLNKNSLLVFESIPWISEQELKPSQPSQGAIRKTSPKKLTESEKIEKLILSNPVYPRASDIVIGVQRIFKSFEVWVGPTATVDRLAELKNRKESVLIFALPLGVPDVVQADFQPSFYFSPDKQGQRKIACRKFFSVSVNTNLMVNPVAWFEIQDRDAPLGEGPLLLNLAFFYSGVKMGLINY
ncbi:MAG: CHAT domain-containing protein, partial [Desulfomonilaceae bacterium]